MDRNAELGLIDELLDLKARKSAFLDPAVARNPVTHYTSDDVFAQEQEKLFQKLPTAVAHASELDGPGAFLRREVGGLPILVTRDKAGEVHGFLNVCRHRGTRLVDAEQGCQHRFSCPYHAWTYANSGELIAAPHFDEGFPSEAKSDLALTRVACAERHGFIWVAPKADPSLDIDAYLGDMALDLAGLAIDEMGVAAEHTETRLANWKILAEGGIEAYHFRVAHRTTIGPHFEDNLSSYQAFGPHMRAVLPRTSMAKLDDATRETWRLRDHANVLYTLFPTSQLLVQQDHIVWICTTPVGPSETRLRLVTLAPKDTLGDGAHWDRNHAITATTLDEDFAIGESIQESAGSGANADMLFGRFEGALDQFNRTVAQYLAA